MSQHLVVFYLLVVSYLLEIVYIIYIYTVYNVLAAQGLSKVNVII